MSILFEAAYHFEVIHSVCHHVFIAFFRYCLVADMLTGSGPRLRNVGRSLKLLESPDAADFRLRPPVRSHRYPRGLVSIGTSPCILLFVELGDV